MYSRVRLAGLALARHTVAWRTSAPFTQGNRSDHLGDNDDLYQRIDMRRIGRKPVLEAGCQTIRECGVRPGSRRERRPSMRRASAHSRAPNATEALRMVLHHMPRAATPWRDMRLQRPGVRIEDWRGNPVTFFQLKLLAEAERRESS